MKARPDAQGADLQLIMSSCVKLDDTACITPHARAARHLPSEAGVLAEPAVLDVPGSKVQTDKNLLQVYRLATEVDVLKRADDYTEMAQLAMSRARTARRSAILREGLREEGLHRRARASTRTSACSPRSRSSVAADKASLAKDGAGTPRPRTNGDEDVSVGLAYLSYKQYPQGHRRLAARAHQAAAIRTATRPKCACCSASRSSSAGDKDEAVKTFKAVKGDAEARAPRQSLEPARAAGLSRSQLQEDQSWRSRPVSACLRARSRR